MNDTTVTKWDLTHVYWRPPLHFIVTYLSVYCANCVWLFFQVFLLARVSFPSHESSQKYWYEIQCQVLKNLKWSFNFNYEECHFDDFAPGVFVECGHRHTNFLLLITVLILSDKKKKRRKKDQKNYLCLFGNTVELLWTKLAHCNWEKKKLTHVCVCSD